jgi:uncharacterized membrane protein YeiH
MARIIIKLFLQKFFRLLAGRAVWLDSENALVRASAMADIILAYLPKLDVFGFQFFNLISRIGGLKILDDIIGCVPACFACL